MYSDHDYYLLNKSLRKHQQLIFKARILIILTEISVRICGLKKTEVILSLFTKEKVQPNHRSTVVTIDRYTIIFNQIKQKTSLNGRCLSQSLVMRHLLREEGITSELKIGVMHRNEQFNAHAWLEKGGVLLNDHPSVIADYLVLPIDKINKTPKFK